MANQSTGTLLPATTQQVRADSTAKCALFIEKDAVFHHLLQSMTTTELSHVILMTSRGYADQAGVRFLQLLAEDMPVFALCDADPHGVKIYLSLKFGTLHSATLPDAGKLRTLQWLPWYLFMRLPCDVSGDLPSGQAPMHALDTSLALQLLDQLGRAQLKKVECPIQYIVLAQFHSFFKSRLISLKKKRENLIVACCKD